MKTAVEWLIEQILEIPLEDATNEAHLKSHINKVTVFDKALEMEKNAHKNLITKFIKNREETRPLIFENGFVKGFDEGMKHSEEFWNELQKTELDEEDFTRKYLQEKCNEYLRNCSIV